MSEHQHFEQTEDSSLALCKVSELSQLSGMKKRALRRYNRIGLLSPEIQLESGRLFYTRHDLIVLERLAVMQMLGLSHTEIKDCLHSQERDLGDELRLQREILLEKRRRINRAIYFIEYAEQVNRDPDSGDWCYLGSVIEAIRHVSDPRYFKQRYVQRESESKTPMPEDTLRPA